MKNLFAILLAISLPCAFSACSSDDEEAVTYETLNDIDLTRISELNGTWITAEEWSSLADDYKSVSLSDTETWEISNDTLIRHVGVYSIPYSISFSDSTIVATRDAYGSTEVWTYKFSRYSQYRLKVERTYGNITTLTSTYLIRRYE